MRSILGCHYHGRKGIMKAKIGMLSNSALLVLLATSGIMNVYLANQVSHQRDAIAKLRIEDRLAVGSWVPSLQGKAASGEPMGIDYADRDTPTVLYVFSPLCRWCKSNFDNATALQRAVSGRYRFVGVSLTSNGLTDYLTQNKIAYPVVTDLPITIKAAYKMAATPTTIVVSPDHKVMKVWAGAFEGQSQQEIEDYFHTKLPGLLAKQIDERPEERASAEPNGSAGKP